jgi:polysaccharide biosynthesis/export protein
MLAVGLGAAALPDVAAQPDYKIGVDDVLTVSVLDQKDLEQTVFVRPDGKISLTLIGEVEAAGLTVEALATRLSELYGRTVRGAQATVGIKEIRSRPVYLSGSVVRPGPIQLTQEMTVLQVLSAAGGPTPTADLESVSVLRGGKRIMVNLQRVIQAGDVAQNLRLQPGDTIVVPTAAAVYVQGEVRTPGQVKYAQDLTLSTAIATAGGFTPLASARRVTVSREAGGKKEVLQVNVNDIMSGDAKDVPLKPNDIISVPQRLF